MGNGGRFLGQLSNLGRFYFDKVTPSLPRSPCWSTQGPSWGYLKVNYSETLSIFGDKCTQNGSKNEQRAPRTSMGCPHIGPFVEPWPLQHLSPLKQQTKSSAYYTIHNSGPSQIFECIMHVLTTTMYNTDKDISAPPKQVLASNAGNADNRSSSPFSLIPSTRSPDPLKQVSLNLEP